MKLKTILIAETYKKCEILNKHTLIYSIEDRQMLLVVINFFKKKNSIINRLVC